MPDSKSSDSKSYVIGIIEIDPIAECQQTWLRLAGDDETLDAVLARLAGHPPRGDMSAGPDSADGLLAQRTGSEPAVARAERHKPTLRQAGRGCVSSERVVANLTELSSALALSLADIRQRLATASSM
jgi:hypothetical protein